MMRLFKLFSFLILILCISFGTIGGCGGGDEDNNGESSGNGGEPEPGGPQFDLELAIELIELSSVAYEQRIQCIEGGKNAITVPSPYMLEEVWIQFL